MPGSICRQACPAVTHLHEWNAPAPQAATTAELSKLEETKRRALAQRAVQMSQLDDLKRRILSERAENKREGEVLRAKAQEEVAEMRAKEELRLAKARQMNADTKAANVALQTFRLKELERQREQEAAIEGERRGHAPAGCCAAQGACTLMKVCAGLLDEDAWAAAA